MGNWNERCVGKGRLEMGRLDGAELVAALGLVFVVSGVVIWWQSVLPAVESNQEALYELVMHVLFGGVVLALGVHIEHSSLEAEDRFAVMAWCFSGFLFLLGLAVWSNVSGLLSGGITPAFASDVVVFGSMGGAFGVIAGANRGHARRNRRLADHVDDQRETLILLTRLLRHDIRNDMMAIGGHADLLADIVGQEGERSIDVIRQRTDSIVRLLGDTDTLVKTLEGPREFERVDLSVVLRQEIAVVVDAHPTVDVQAELADDLEVVADGLVHQLFSNLLTNAVAHNDPADLTIRVAATDRGDTVEIVVADDGVGIPEPFRESCFELGEQGPDSDGDGLGLWLVSRLADVYGGSVELTDEPGWGARFVVTLPTADRSSLERRGSSRP